MEEYIQQSGRKVIRKVEGHTLTRMVQSLLESGRMIEEMVREHLHGEMGTNT